MQFFKRLHLHGIFFCEGNAVALLTDDNATGGNSGKPFFEI